MISKLEESLASLKAAEEFLLPTEEMTKMDAYLLAYFKCSKSVISEAIAAIKNSSRYKRRKKPDLSESE